ncbi:MAG: NADH-quinone oxidoreductase subunit N [Bacteroidota bacterium]
MANEILKELMLGFPIFFLSATGILLVISDALTGKNKVINYIFAIIILSLTIGSSGWILLNQYYKEASSLASYPITMGMLAYNGYAYIFDVIFGVAALLTIIAAREYNERAEFEYKEFYSLVVLATVGMMMIAHSADLLLMFIGIEFMSITFYVLAGYFRKKITSVEAALKYFLLGAFASGFLLYGIALIYGATGTLTFQTISQKILAQDYNNLYLILGITLVFIGLSFKIAAFPFHQWAPDVYHGAPTVISGFLSTAGKAAAIFAFILIGKNIMFVAIRTLDSNHIITLQNILAVLSAATMLVGNITAIAQNNVKRMLAYSSVAHAGYMLMGIVANTPDGWAGASFYATVYVFMQIGSFAIVANLEGKDGEYLDFSHYSGLYKTRPFVSVMMVVFLLSLAGIPPFAGFFGKYYIFKSAINAGYLWLTIVGIVSSLISVYFYLRLLIYIYFREASEQVLHTSEPRAAGFTLLISAALTVLLGVFPSYLIELLLYLR